MAVYVDDMYTVPMGQFRRMKMSHMIGDTDDELHALAQRIGVARKWYQGDHYDVSKSMRAAAIKAGAKEITMRELARIVMERRKAMARKPPAKKAAKPSSTLLASLRFIEPASRDSGSINQLHSALSGNWAVAFDGIVALACPTDTDIVAYPHTKKFITALTKCGDTMQITQLDQGRLAIKSGKFSAYVPCIEPALFSILPPDPPDYPIDERVVKSLEIVGRIAKENAPRLVLSIVLLRSGSAVATDGVVMFEHWHGCTVPECLVPKVFVTELLKIAKKPTHLGRSNNTMTIYFEDKSWIRTQLYDANYPEVDRLLNTEPNLWPVPAGFWDALEKIKGLDDGNVVFFSSQAVRTNASNDVGASCEIDGVLPENLCFNSDYLRMFAPYAKTVDWLADNGRMAVFYGENFRGMVMAIRPQPVYQAKDDDEIPF